MTFNTQSNISVISGRNTTCLIKSQSFDSSKHFAVFVWRGFGENEVEWTGEAEISRLEALAVGKACFARLYSSYSRLGKRKHLTALTAPTREEFWISVGKRMTTKLMTKILDRCSMFYAQSTAKGHIKAKQNVFLPQVKTLTYHKWKLWVTIQYTLHHWGLKKFRENEVEWAGKAETR